MTVIIGCYPERIVASRKAPFAKYRLTAAEYRALPESMARRSLIGGWLVEEPSASDAHQRLALNLAFMLESVLRPAGLGTLRFAPYDVWLTEEIVVQPDVLVVRRGREQIIQANGIHGAPDLVVEIMSPSTRQLDRNGKRLLYGRNGVAEMWLVDPNPRRLEVYRFAEHRDEPVRVVGPGDDLFSLLSPELRLSVAEIFDR